MLTLFNRFGTVGRTWTDLAPFSFDEIYALYESDQVRSIHSKARFHLYEATQGQRTLVEKKTWQQKAIQQMLKEDSSQMREILSWESIPEMEDLPQIRFLSVTSKMQRFVEDKMNLLKILTESGVEEQYFIRTVTNLSDLSELFHSQKRVMIQKNGIFTGGNGNIFIGNDQRLTEFIESNPLEGSWKGCEFISGDSYNINLLVIGSETYIECPSRKVMGIQELGISDWKSSGNQWGEVFPFSRQVCENLITNLEKIGSYLSTIGFQGVFGVDLISSPETGSIRINELNSRIQGTTELASLCQRAREFTPFPIVQCQIFSSSLPDFTPSITARQYNEETISLMMSGYRGPFYVKLRAPQEGFNHLEERSSFTLETGNTITVINPPKIGVFMASGVEWCTLEGSGWFPFEKDKSLSEDLSALVVQLKKRGITDDRANYSNVFGAS